MDTLQRPRDRPVLTYWLKIQVDIVVMYWDDGKRQSCPCLTTLEWGEVTLNNISMGGGFKKTSFSYEVATCEKREK